MSMKDNIREPIETSVWSILKRKIFHGRNLCKVEVALI